MSGCSRVPAPPARMMPLRFMRCVLGHGEKCLRRCWRPASRQGSARTPKVWANKPLSSSEFAGRRAGVGYSALVIGTTLGSRPVNRALRCDDRGGRTRARSSRPCRRSDRCPRRAPALASRGAMCRIASARSAVEVGQPRWSATKRSSSRSRASRSTVLRRLRPKATVNPRGPQDEVLGMPGADRLFSGSLGAAVDAERRDRISLDVGAGLRAVEHVVGRDVDQRDAGAGARLGKNGGPLGIAPRRLPRSRSRPCRPSCRPRR